MWAWWRRLRESNGHDADEAHREATRLAEAAKEQGRQAADALRMARALARQADQLAVEVERAMRLRGT